MQLHRIDEQIHQAGAEEILIGNGGPSFIDGFRAKSGFTGAIYTDPSKELFQALELRRGLRSSLNLRSAGRALSAYRAGFRQTSVQGDPLQQGGVFVVTPRGEFTLAYRSAYAGDHPSDSQILAAVRQAVSLTSQELS